jgi:hypothetical protein
MLPVRLKGLDYESVDFRSIRFGVFDERLESC